MPNIVLHFFICKDNSVNRMHPNEVTSPASGNRNHGFVDYQGIGLQQQFPPERKWALGLQVILILGLSLTCLYCLDWEGVSVES